VERCEAYAGGLELANAFGELTDAVEQRRRFAAETEERRARGLPVYPIDERFLAALEEGLPECGGIALGVDRLLMLLTGATTIGEVQAFSTAELR
jgi:lysyl-tRNA synthetase class 2